jgi:hypothetical protein
MNELQRERIKYLNERVNLKLIKLTYKQMRAGHIS